MSAPRNPAGILASDAVFSDVSTGSLVAQQTQARSMMINKGLYDLFSGEEWNGSDLKGYSADGGVAVNSAVDVNGVKVMQDYSVLFGEVADNLTPATRIASLDALVLHSNALDVDNPGEVIAPAGYGNVFTFQMYTGNANDNGAGWLHYPVLAPFWATLQDVDIDLDANAGNIMPTPQWIATAVGNQWKAVPCWDFKDTDIVLPLATHLS